MNTSRISCEIDRHFSWNCNFLLLILLIVYPHFSSLHHYSKRVICWCWCVDCTVWCLADERGPVPVPVRGYDLLWLRWWNGASLQSRRPALRRHATSAAPPPHRCVGCHWGQVRESSGATQPSLGRHPLQDQTHSIHSASCLKWHQFTI